MPDNRKDFLDKICRIGKSMRDSGNATVNVVAIFLHRCKVEFNLTDDEFDDLWRRLVKENGHGQG